MSSRPHLTEVGRIDKQEPEPASGCFRGLLRELRKRKVCRTAISYMLVMWLNLQVGDVIFPMIGLPDWSLSLIIIIGVMGFPVVLILAWAFQITPEGIVLDDRDISETGTDRQLDTVVNLLLLVSSIVLSVLLLLQFYPAKRVPLLAISAMEEPRGVVLSDLAFESATQEADGLILAAGILDELRHRLINLEGMEVLSTATPAEVIDDSRSVALSGTLFLEGSTVHVVAYLVDLSAGRYLMSVAFDLEVISTLALESAAAQKIVEEVSRTLRAGQDQPIIARNADAQGGDGMSWLSPGAS